jgi:hypothetical protein
MAKSFAGLGVTSGLASDRAAITSPPAGMQFFETDTKLVYAYDGASWIKTNYVGLRPEFFARVSVSTTATGTNKLPWNTTVRNVGTCFNTSTYTFTAPITGLYQFNASVFENTTNSGVSDLIVSGVIVGRNGFETALGGYPSYAHAGSFYMNYGETAYMQNAFGTTHMNSATSFFAGYLVSV